MLTANQVLKEFQGNGENRQDGPAPTAKREDKSLWSHDLSKKPTLDKEALHGLAGKIVHGIEPYTESHPAAVLTNILTAFGNVIGSNPHFKVEHTRHHLNLFIAQVGVSSKGRKGTGWSTPRYMFCRIDSAWGEKRIRGGLSSGEGLIYEVRDKRIEKREIKRGELKGEYEEYIADHGVDDKRLLCVEEEFSQALKVMSREGNILSPNIRAAWDGSRLAPMTKNSPIQATGAHISIIGHITRDELLRYLTSTEQSNGFANRFCWFFVERVRKIPNPQGCPDEKLSPLIEQLRDAVDFARKVGEMRRDPEAETIWAEVYSELSEEKPGILGAMTARAEAQVMRLACLYALLDRSEVIRVNHLTAALALWDFSEKSTQFIFGDLLGDPVADRILKAVKDQGEMSETEIRDLFGPP
jgi:hypothetical protein